MVDGDGRPGLTAGGGSRLTPYRSADGRRRPNLACRPCYPGYAFVWEVTCPSLSAWEGSMSDTRGAEEWAAWDQKFAPLLDGGHREIFTVVE
jgi:hypothetical protein